VGSLDFKELNYLDVKEIDHGLDFYAPHIISNGNILISWMSIWERSLPLQELGNKWMNAFTMPRVLSLNNNKLIQKPLAHFSEYFVEEANYEMNINEEVNLLKGQFKHLHLEFDNDSELSVKLFKKDDKYCEVKYIDNKVYIDRRNSLTPIVSKFNEKSMDNYRYVSVNSNKIVLDIYLDRFLVEVYINEGEEVMSFTCVHPLDYDDISFKGNNKLVKIISKNFSDK
jgi:beta-fructofuranosidase